MRSKMLPSMFLVSLFCILLFILGLRYGQHVEQINQTTSFLANISPSPTSSPTAIPLAFLPYTHATCGASLLIPSQLLKTQESSSSAVFSTVNKKLAIALSCEKKLFIQNNNEKRTLLNTLPAFETMTQDTYSYRIYNAKIGRILTLTTTKEFLPLLQKTFEISKP